MGARTNQQIVAIQETLAVTDTILLCDDLKELEILARRIKKDEYIQGLPSECLAFLRKVYSTHHAILKTEEPMRARIAETQE